MRLMPAAVAIAACLSFALAAPAAAQESIPSFEQLVAQPVALKPELAGVHPRVFVTAAGIEALRVRAKTTHREEWARALATLIAVGQEPPPPPGPQERRSQNVVGLAIAGASLAYAVEQDPKYLRAAKAWTLAAIDYEPWGYTFNKPNTDLAAGHLLYAIGWAYDLLYHEWTAGERVRIRQSLERHAGLVYDAFAPKPKRRHSFTQNHNFIPTAGLAVTALALMGESPDAPRWAALARAHHNRAGQLLSPDGYYYEGFEYWIFSTPWLVHFLDAWEHSTGESLWDRGQFRNWKYMVAHSILPDGQTVADFGDIWQGPLTRAKQGEDYAREYPTGALKSNFNLLYRVAARFRDGEAQAVAARLAAFGHTNQEEWWTLLWRDPSLPAAPMHDIPLAHHFDDSGVFFHRTSWDAGATASALKSGPPEGHRATRLLASIPEWQLSSGHAHPDAGSFIIWAGGRYLTGDTGYAGQPQARHHNTITVGGIGQGDEGAHDVWRNMSQTSLDTIRITRATADATGVRVEADVAGAYPQTAGLARFHRVFTFDGKAAFTVEDTIATTAPKTVEWFLHADAPIATENGAFRLGSAPAALRVRLDTPAGSKTSTGPTFLTAPGLPGSITSGKREQRGYEVRVDVPAASAIAIKASLTIEMKR
jgi:hypothetical protein